MPIDQNLMASAITVGIVAALAVLFAFFKPFRRFVSGSGEFADALGAGIWIRAVGTIAAGSSVMAKMAVGHGNEAILALYLFGWLMVVGGYYLHFSAWQGVYYNRKGVFALEFLAVLVVIGFASFWFFGWINPKT